MLWADKRLLVDRLLSPTIWTLQQTKWSTLLACVESPKSQVVSVILLKVSADKYYLKILSLTVLLSCLNFSLSPPSLLFSSSDSVLLSLSVVATLSHCFQCQIIIYSSLSSNPSCLSLSLSHTHTHTHTHTHRESICYCETTGCASDFPSFW